MLVTQGGSILDSSLTQIGFPHPRWRKVWKDNFLCSASHRNRNIITQQGQNYHGCNDTNPLDRAVTNRVDNSSACLIPFALIKWNNSLRGARVASRTGHSRDAKVARRTCPSEMDQSLSVGKSVHFVCVCVCVWEREREREREAEEGEDGEG